MEDEHTAVNLRNVGKYPNTHMPSLQLIKRSNGRHFSFMLLHPMFGCS